MTPTTIRDGLELLASRVCAAGGVVEVALLKTQRGTVRGYFTTPDGVEPALSGLDAPALRPEGVYITLGAVRPDLLARCAGRFESYARTRVADADITRRLWLPIDCDPVRPAGISATEAELQASIARCDAVVTWLRAAHGWPEPVRASGGNSGHALFAIDLPNEATSDALVKRVLDALTARFSDDAVHVDSSVHNAARIWTLYGTLKRKGDSTPDRPHRRSWIASRPDPLVCVSCEQLEAVAQPTTTRSTGSRTPPTTTETGVLDMAAEFTSRGWYLRDLNGGKHAVTCPWADQHSSESGLTETCLFEPRTAGELWGFKCQHAHCADRSIHDVWLLVRPPQIDERDIIVEPPAGADRPPTRRTLTLTPASAIAIRPVRWLWDRRLALGTINLLGGREGIGKSIVECTLASEITRGRLPGVYQGTPRSVIMAATEDSWAHTIVPRLMAADADLTQVYRVALDATHGGAVSLPRDLPAVEQLITDRQVAALMLDPLLSRLDGTLDSHKDAEVRLALEPLAATAERTGCTVLGLIHVNKTASTDPLTTLMASRAFAAVARGVLFVMTDPDDDGARLLGQPKNNLGRADLPTLAFRIESALVATTPEGPVWTGRLHWTGETDRSIQDALQQVADMRGENRTAVQEAAEWLQDYLASQNGAADSAEAKREGTKAGHTKDAIHRARTKLNLVTVSVGFPRRTQWMQSSDRAPGSTSLQSSDPPGETSTTPTTQTTAAKRTYSDPAPERQLLQSSESSELSDAPGDNPTTAPTHEAKNAVVGSSDDSDNCGQLPVVGSNARQFIEATPSWVTDDDGPPPEPSSSDAALADHDEDPDAERL